MSEKFDPKLEILPQSQRILWTELNCVPEDFHLYGGTAIALRLGHRQSIDFDFFGTRDFDPDTLLNSLPFFADAKVTQKSRSTLSAVVNRGDDVFVSFFGVPELKRVRPGDTVAENGITIASICDLAGTKAAVIQKRAELKDYLDFDAMLQAKVVDLPTALNAGRMIYGQQFNPELTLKALCYFEDGNVRKLPDEARKRLIEAVRQVNIANLPEIDFKRSLDQGYSQ